MKHKRTVVLGSLLMLCLAACGVIALPETPMESATPEAAAIAQGDAAHGRLLFAEGQDNAPPCVTCHAIGQTALHQFGATIGPNLHRLAERADERVTGLSAEDYIRASIVDPSAYVVEGYSDLMYKAYAEAFSEDDLNDLVAYLLSL
ncbi:MAG: c-type cytochrome [bacterium]|nr:c-type cytochrome [bacterium]